MRRIWSCAKEQRLFIPKAAALLVFPQIASLIRGAENYEKKMKDADHFFRHKRGGGLSQSMVSLPLLRVRKNPWRKKHQAKQLRDLFLLAHAAERGFHPRDIPIVKIKRFCF